MIPAAFAIAALLALATLVHVYRGGTTLNDHFVAAVVIGCVGVYPVVFAGGVSFGAPAGWLGGWPLVMLGLACLVGAAAIYALFFVLDTRREARLLLPATYISQPAFAFSLWTGLLYTLWWPVAGLAWLGGVDLASYGLHPLWPGAALLVPTLLTAWGTAWTYGRHNVARTHVLPAPELGRPVRLVHLSDLHASPVMTGPHLRAVVARANALEPDLVVITGDLVMPFSEAHHPYLIDALAELRAPAFACPGNHDLPVSDTLRTELEGIGIRWLVDESCTVALGADGDDSVIIEVAGVDFQWQDAAGQVARAMPAMGAPPEAHYRVLLAHDPRLFAFVPEDRFDLVLSGHTHGGQVGTDMFGVPWSVLRLPGLYDQGFFERGPARLYVHRGNWHTGLPPRMGIASEVVCLVLGGATGGG